MTSRENTYKQKAGTSPAELNSVITLFCVPRQIHLQSGNLALAFMHQN